jgi:mycothiol synthase
MYCRACEHSDAQPIFALINAAVELDKTSRVRESFFQEEFFSGPQGSPTDMASVAIDDDGAIAGFAWWHEFPDPYGLAIQGWVHPERRRRGAGTGLLRAAERYAQRHAREHIYGSYLATTSRNYQMAHAGLMARAYDNIPGAQALFVRQGYREVRRFHKMKINIENGRKAEDISTPNGVTLRAFQPGDLEKLVEADNAFFANHWGAHPADVEGWKRRMIDGRPHDPALWIIAWAGEQIVGECLCNASQQDGPRDGWVSTVGIHPRWRRRGLGRTILVRGFQVLRQRGFQTASLHVDADNAPAVSLYQGLGMEIARTHVHFLKTISFQSL